MAAIDERLYDKSYWGLAPKDDTYSGYLASVGLDTKTMDNRQSVFGDIGLAENAAPKLSAVFDPTSVRMNTKATDSYFNAYPDEYYGSKDLTTDYNKDTPGLLDGMTTDNWLTAGKVGLGLLNYGESKRVNDKNIQSINQQMAMNRRSVDNKDNIMTAFKGGDKKVLTDIG